MNKLKNQRGVLLLCTLVIMVILSVFLMVGVYRMESSVMATKKTIWEIKSYWGAKAGNTIAADGCLKSYNWPNISNGFITDAGYLAKNEKYVIIKNGNVITGSDNTSDSSFSIYYKNNINSVAFESSAPSESTLSDTFEAATTNIVKEGEFYALTAGKSGPYVSGLEFLYAIDKKCTNYINPAVQQNNMNYGQATSAAAAIYVESNLKATLDQQLTVTQNNGTRGCIVAGGEVTITGSGGVPNNWGSGPVNLDEGAIFANKATLNDKEITPSYQSDNLINFSVNVFPNPTVEVNIPSLNPINGKTVPSGTFCFVEMPEKYVKAEYEATVDAMIDVYLNPKQFYDIYAQDFKKNADNFTQLCETIKDNDIDVIECNDGSFNCKTIFNNKFDAIKYNNQSVYDYFKECAEADDDDGLFGNAIEGLRRLLFVSDDDVMTSERKAEILEKLYKNYLISKINVSITQYRATSKNYESMFIPQGNVGINTNIHSDNPQIFYGSFTKARIIGNLKEYCEHPDIYSSSTVISVYDTLASNLSERLGLEKEEYKKNIIKTAQDYPDSYYTDKVNVKDGDMFVLNKLSEFHDFGSHETADKFTDAKNFISFNKNDLAMTVGCDLEVQEGFFNFATFERRGDTSGMESHAHTYLGDYKQAENERAGIKLDTDCSVTAPIIDVLGFVYGRGYVQSTSGDIIFEAVGSGINSGAEDRVSILSNNNIRIKSKSASNAGASGGTASFKGILYAKKQIEVKVAEDNIGFNITGTVICNSMDFNAKNLTVKYDPDLSRIIISKFVPNWNKQSKELQKAIDEGTSEYTLNPGHIKYFNRI